MRQHTKERAIIIGQYYVENKSTIRETATALGIDRNIVYRDLSENLPLIDKELAVKVRLLLNENREGSPVKASNTSKIVRAQRKN